MEMSPRPKRRELQSLNEFPVIIYGRFVEMKIIFVLLFFFIRTLQLYDLQSPSIVNSDSAYLIIVASPIRKKLIPSLYLSINIVRNFVECEN